MKRVRGIIKQEILRNKHVLLIQLVLVLLVLPFGCKQIVDYCGKLPFHRDPTIDILFFLQKSFCFIGVVPLPFYLKDYLESDGSELLYTFAYGKRLYWGIGCYSVYYLVLCWVFLSVVRMIYPFEFGYYLLITVQCLLYVGLCYATAFALQSGIFSAMVILVFHAFAVNFLPDICKKAALFWEIMPDDGTPWLPFIIIALLLFATGCVQNRFRVSVKRI